MRLAPLLVRLLVVAGSLAVGSPAVAIELPTVALTPRPELLIATVQPASGTHLAADLPLSARVHDGYFTFEVNEPLPPPGAARLRLPLVREKRIEAWTVTVQGAACADDGTTCVPFHVQATLPPGKLKTTLTTEPGRARPAKPERPRPPPPAPQPAEPPGDRLVLHDFYATWCPPCDRLRDEFLEHPDWASLLSGYEVRSLDADDPDSFAEKDRYRVGGYPTLLLTTADGEVLERIVGFPGAEEVARRLRAVGDGDGAAAGEGCESALPMVRVRVAREQHEDAWTALQLNCPEPASLAPLPGALVLAFELASELDHRQQALTYALAGAAREADLGTAARLAHEAAKLLEPEHPTEAAALRERTGARIDEALARKDAGPDAMISLADALYYRGKWRPEPTEDHARAADLLGQAIILRAKAQAGPLPDTVLALHEGLREHEGLVHDYIYLLRSAERHDDVGRMYGAMLTLFPEAFTWHYAQAGWLVERGALDKAEPAARLALEHSYGDMSLRAAKRLAEILIARGEPSEALDTIDHALSAPLPTEQHVRTWRYREALTALRDTIASPGPR